MIVNIRIHSRAISYVGYLTQMTFFKSFFDVWMIWYWLWWTMTGFWPSVILCTTQSSWTIVSVSS
jgi:hypothetical protein